MSAKRRRHSKRRVLKLPPPPPPRAAGRPVGASRRAAGPSASGTRPRRRHPAARSRVIAGVLSALAFVGLGGTMAANATQNAASSDGASRATASTGTDDARKQTGERTSSTDIWSGAQPAAPILGQSPISSSSGS